MTKNSQYIIGVIMIAFSGYQLTIPEYWEFALYISAGLAFIVMGMIKNEVFPNHKKLMTILSWVLIFIAGFLLLFLARTDF
jgi:uncharacterized membrane protein HdeD (DUF308 family)